MSFLKPGLFTGIEDDAKGKTPEAVTKSRASRDDLVIMFGSRNLPSSIMVRQDMHKIRKLDDAAAGSYTDTMGRHGDADMHRIAKTTAISSSGVQAGALSVFPQNVGRTVLLFYSKPGDVVIDPFAGHNSRMQLVVKEGRHYAAQDVSKRFMKHNRERAAVLKDAFPGIRIALREQDSRKFGAPDNSGDFTITSPPYWDIEDYGDEPEQLGKGKTYEEFMQGMEQVLRENVRVLKSGAYSCWFINDFRRGGKMYFYHIDLLQAGERAGFIAHDIAIIDFVTSFSAIFLNQAYENKTLPKRHEYCVVFRKP